MNIISRSLVDDFLSQKSLALVGVSRDGSGFGNAVLRTLLAQGYDLHVVHHEAGAVAGQSAVKRLSDIAGKVGGVVLVTPPGQTEALVRDAAAAGIRRVWIQQGAESDDAIAFCEQHGIAVVHHECILMFAEPHGVHRLHRWINGWFGKLPH